MKTRAFKETYGPYALVAGGSYGLGAAFAEAIARRGVNLVLIARQEERLEATAARLRGTYAVDVISVVADMADFDDVKQRIGALGVPIGLLVYDAAFAPVGLFENTSEEHLALATAVNVRAPLLLTKLLATSMIRASARWHGADVLSCRGARRPEHRGVCGHQVLQRDSG